MSQSGESDLTKQPELQNMQTFAVKSQDSYYKSNTASGSIKEETTGTQKSTNLSSLLQKSDEIISILHQMHTQKETKT